MIKSSEKGKNKTRRQNAKKERNKTKKTRSDTNKDRANMRKTTRKKQRKTRNQTRNSEITLFLKIKVLRGHNWSPGTYYHFPIRGHQELVILLVDVRGAVVAAPFFLFPHFGSIFFFVSFLKMEEVNPSLFKMFEEFGQQN